MGYRDRYAFSVPVSTLDIVEETEGVEVEDENGTVEDH
jgi:hypothetical protein